MKTQFPTQEQMHADHVERRSELALWEDELHTWRLQQARALSALTRLSARLQEHGAALLEQEQTVRKLERELRQHEHELFELQQTGVGEQADPQLERHLEVTQQHAAAQAVQERIKKHHREVLAEYNRLISVLEG